MQNGKLLLVSVCMLVIAAGCQTTRWEPTLTAPVAPTPVETVVLDNLIVIFDGSGSMTLENKYTTGKRFLRSFIQAMPEGNYGVTALSFGGEWRMDWPQHPQGPFDRPAFATYADSLCPIMGSTFLTEAVEDFGSNVSNHPGHTAVLIISDGKAEDPYSALGSVSYLQSLHAGPLCVYTVQVGDDEAGGQLLFDMAARTGCGRGVHVDTVSSPGGLEAFMREIFFGERGNLEMLGTPGESKTMLFGSGKSFIRPEYTMLLQEIAQMMEVTPDARLRIEGHADTTGSESANAALALQRAEAVKRALSERGVSAARMEAVGYGESRPADAEGTAAGRQLNRRVDVIVLRP